MANIKYIGRDTEVSEYGKIHKVKDKDFTACGKKYSDNSEDWVKTNESVTCKGNGCD